MPVHPDLHLLERQKCERRETLYKTSLALSGAKIRVFIVEGAEKFNIRGELEIVDLDNPDHIQFDALSYRWGNPSQKRPILCPHSNVELQATSNCISAISHIYRLHCRRHRYYNESHPLAIWIDAICINQEDELERSNQVRLMGRIYANARETYFWLGEGDRDTDRAMEYLRKGCLSSPTSSPWLNAFGILWRILIWYWYRLHSGLDEVLSRDWVNRVWTLQECILSRNGTVVCGDQQCPWLQIVLSVQFSLVASKGFMPNFPPKSLQVWASLTGL
ncbi:heterokaryon incompatibility protein-domain-containing protein [Diaporthe sp. PMI_573]|nr:heterokaryon incompatibility protein-domain-containing protein [Diaporthaceae sp. PMI_573]